MFTFRFESNFEGDRCLKLCSQFQMNANGQSSSDNSQFLLRMSSASSKWKSRLSTVSFAVRCSRWKNNTRGHTSIALCFAARAQFCVLSAQFQTPRPNGHSSVFALAESLWPEASAGALAVCAACDCVCVDAGTAEAEAALSFFFFLSRFFLLLLAAALSLAAVAVCPLRSSPAPFASDLLSVVVVVVVDAISLCLSRCACNSSPKRS